MNNDPGPWGIVLGLLMFGAIVLIVWIFKKAKREPLEKNAPPGMQWIPLSERLPMRYQVVDVYCKNFRVTRVFLDRDETGDYFVSPHGRIYLRYVSHWMVFQPPN